MVLFIEMAFLGQCKPRTSVPKQINSLEMHQNKFTVSFWGSAPLAVCVILVAPCCTVQPHARSFAPVTFRSFLVPRMWKGCCPLQLPEGAHDPPH